MDRSTPAPRALARLVLMLLLTSAVVPGALAQGAAEATFDEPMRFARATPVGTLPELFEDLPHFCLRVPNIGEVEAIGRGFLRGGTIFMARFDHPTASVYVVSSTLPAGRTPAEEMQIIEQRETETARRVAEAGHAPRYRVTAVPRPWGRAVVVQATSVLGGSSEGPFPIGRQLAASADEPPHNQTVHVMFAHEGNRFEVAVVDAPDAKEPSPAAPEVQEVVRVRALVLAQRYADAINACTPGTEPAGAVGAGS